MTLRRLAIVFVFYGCAEPKSPAVIAPPPCPVCPPAVVAAPECPPVVPTPKRTPIEAAEAPSPQPEWTAAPPKGTTTFFREVYLGMLPRPHRRTTWTLIQSGTAVLLRAEDQVAKHPFDHLDRTSTFPDGWSAPKRSEYAGTASAAAGTFTVTLKRAFGAHEPAELVLKCAPRTIAVHPAFATLVEGWKRSDDSMEPASWAPPRTENVVVTSCKGELQAFEDGLSFAKPRKETTTEPELVGVEWAHVNSDMVIQQGGYRWITGYSMK